MEAVCPWNSWLLQLEVQNVDLIAMAAGMSGAQVEREAAPSAVAILCVRTCRPPSVLCLRSVLFQPLESGLASPSISSWLHPRARRWTSLLCLRFVLFQPVEG